MILRTLKLQNFRNLSNEYNLSNRINIIVGKNGLGKTNLLEAVSYLASGKSFRTNYDVFTIKKSLLDIDTIAFSRIEANIIDSLGNQIKKEIYIERTGNCNGNGSKKVLKIDGKRVSLMKFNNRFQSTVFSPNTIDLVINSPATRRSDLDDFISVFDDSYFDLLAKYRKVVRNRNIIFEKIFERKGKKEELIFWNKEMYKLAPRIIYLRVSMIDRINKVIKAIGPQMFNLDVDNLSIEYFSKFVKKSKKFKDITGSFEKKIKQNIEKEIRAGRTLYGPQREDFIFILNSSNLKDIGSRGQQRLFSLLYKLAQWKILKKKTGYPPILLLDDVFSELDKKVQENLCQYLEEIEVQTIITTTRLNSLNKKFLIKSRSIKL